MPPGAQPRAAFFYPCCYAGSVKSPARAFSLIELLVVIGLIGLLLAILLPVAEHVRHNSYKVTCAANLHQLGDALRMYTNDNHGVYPRTKYVAGAPVTQGTGGAASDPFGATGPVANDVTAPIFLLLRAQKLPAVTLICPYDDVNVFTPEPADPQTRSNFTDWKKNLGYSYANPYPSASAAEKDYRLSDRLPSDFAVMADLNPGPVGYGGNLLSITAASSASLKERINSENHEDEGQNVLYADGHVDWADTVFAGPNHDNIFTTRDGQMDASPMDGSDCVLLPHQ